MCIHVYGLLPVFLSVFFIVSLFVGLCVCACLLLYMFEFVGVWLYCVLGVVLVFCF